LAKCCLFVEVPKLIAKQQFLCAFRGAKHGKKFSEQEKIKEEVTVDEGIEDLDVLRVQGFKALRQLRIMQISQEAFDQGGLLTQEDLGRILQVSARTIRDDIRELVKDENIIHSRGYDHDIGRSVSHKSRIIELYLKG
jgi:predicted HTH transcriptional regulator